jgi:CheY-like chemotaxis protein/HPt (histidine-containing phosphotransfer) domain-containing protein
VLQVQLQAWGLRSEAAADGPSALQALHRARIAGDPFQAAILDQKMPGIDGVALGQLIKSDDKLQKTHLVMLIPLGQPGNVLVPENVIAASLTKPTRPSDLFDCLSSVLAGIPMPCPTQHLVPPPAFRELRQGAVRILLAEDNITNQQVFVAHLKKLGLRVDAVANGLEALKALETIPYDLVLMDVQMPEMDGLDATRAIRNPQSAVLDHHLPIIALTAHAMQGDRDKCLAAGMSDYLSKPTTPQALLEKLNHWLPAEQPIPSELAPKPLIPPTSAMPLSPEAVVFNKKKMMHFLTDDLALVRTILRRYLDDFPKQLEALKQNLAAGETASVERRAHGIKGAAATVGGERLCLVATEMEKCGKAGDLKSVADLLPALELQFAQLKQAMSDLVV